HHNYRIVVAKQSQQNSRHHAPRNKMPEVAKKICNCRFTLISHSNFSVKVLDNAHAQRSTPSFCRYYTTIIFFKQVFETTVILLPKTYPEIIFLPEFLQGTAFHLPSISLFETQR